MNAEIIAVGSEMLTHKRVDTNSLFLTEQLNNLGMEVVAKHVIGDDRERLSSQVRRSLGSADIVVLCGGLGPTEDDLTRDAVAQALGRELHFSSEIADQLAHRFRVFLNRPMPEINKRQAMVIQGADVLSNDRGTAPGQWIQEGGRILLLLPGPPHEMQSMFNRTCLPRLEKIAPPAVIRTLELRIAGMSEADLDQTISPIYKPYANPVTTILAHNGDMKVQLRAQCATEAAADALLAEVGNRIGAILGDRIYSRNGDPLEAVIGRRLLAAGETLAVAESATGGGLADRISSVPGASAWFLGGFVTYTGRMKMDQLGVSQEILNRFGPVSRETAEQMAEGALSRTGATYAVSVTGNAGPATDGPEAPVGMIIVGIAGPCGTQTWQRQWPAGDRARIRAFAAQMALDLLRRKLIEQGANRVGA